MALVPVGDSEGGNRRRVNVRAVFQSPGDGRRKVSFACDAGEFGDFLRVLDEGSVGEFATVSILRSRGFMEASVKFGGIREIRFEVSSSRTRCGTNGVVIGTYRIEPVRRRTESSANKRD